MATDSFTKGSENFPAANFDGSCDLPHCSVDVLPIIIDEASVPVEEKSAFRNSHVSSCLLR
ncbi:hypothetical protein OIU78_028374 [Salix suchowensis]|nr:hypothetical protein OIU78_028374 [Salix suchowensis]